MKVPAALRRLDERVLGRPRGRTPEDADGPPPPRGDGPRAVARVVLRVSQLVLVVLALVVVLGMVFTATPTNDDNVIVRNALSLAADATGPFEDVFTPEGGNRALYANYATAAGVYLLLAVALGKVRDRLGAKR